jgi:hypothetical protein
MEFIKTLDGSFFKNTWVKLSSTTSTLSIAFVGVTR